METEEPERQRQQANVEMSVLHRFANSLRTHGLAATLAKLRSPVADRWFDWRNGTDTCDSQEINALTLSGPNSAHARRYQPTRVLLLRAFFRALMPMLPAESVLLDYGAGKGRVLLVAAEFSFKAVRGVEIAPELCAIAERNRAAWEARNPQAPAMQIIHADAAAYAVRPDETVFFFFNPFDEVVLEQVVVRMVNSLRTHPRRVFAAYYNPDFAGVFERSGIFHRVPSFRVPGYAFALFSNEPRPS